MKTRKTLIIPNRQNIEESLRLAREYDCGFEYNDFFVPSVLDDREKLTELVAFYKGLKGAPDYCTLHGAFLDITIFSEDERIRQASDFRVEQSLKIAEALGAAGVVFHTNYLPNFRQEAYRKGWLEKNEAYWRGKLKKYPGLMLYLENMFDTDWELLAGLGERLKEEPNFGICFDYAHAHAFGEAEQIGEWVKALAPYVKHLHINDNDFCQDQHLPVGSGRIDWQGFRDYYETYFPQATVLVEMTGEDRIKQSLEYLHRL